MVRNGDRQQLEEFLPQVQDSTGQRRERLARVQQYCDHSVEQCKSLVKFLLGKHCLLQDRFVAHAQAFKDLKEIHEEQRKLISELSAPPWYPALFVRLVETEADKLAEVHDHGGRRLVRVGENVDAACLIEGQVVYLGHERNAILSVAKQWTYDAGEVVSVERVLDDGRILLKDRDLLIVVRQSESLKRTDLKPGDQVIWSREAMFAMERIEKGRSDELFCKEYLSAEAVQTLGGQGPEVERVIALFTQSIAEPEIAARYGLSKVNTLLLHGPPGNGKTSLARIVGAALAAITGNRCRFASVKGAQLESPWVGSTQKAIRVFFEELRREDCPTLLFIDEVEAIGRIRGEIGGHHSDKFLSSWLTELDGLAALPRSLGIIVSTNRKDLMDPAMLERLSGSDLYIGSPNLSAAREIFDIHLPPDLPYGPNRAEAMITRAEIIDLAVAKLYSPNADNSIGRLHFRNGSTRVVSASQLLSGRTIEQICMNARRSAFCREAETGLPGVGVEDMEESVSQVMNRLASTLTPVNARAMLSDLPQDLDIVAVEPVDRSVVTHRYLRREVSARG